MLYRIYQSRVEVVQSSQNQCGQKGNGRPIDKAVPMFLFGAVTLLTNQTNWDKHTYILCPGQLNLALSFSRVSVTPRWAPVVELWIDSKILGRNVVGTTCKWLSPVLESSKLRHRISFTTLRESKLFQRTRMSLDWPWRTEWWGCFPSLTQGRTVRRLWSSSCACCMSFLTPFPFWVPLGLEFCCCGCV